MVSTKVIVKRGNYRDSITLMKISNALRGLKGVSQAAVVMATQLNKKLLADVGFRASEVDNAATEDMIVALEAKDDSSLNAAIAETETLLSSAGTSVTQDSAAIRTLGEALEAMPDANLVVISVPGQFAKREALQALGKGLNVFLFSSNVSREDELQLKKLAREKHLLMMGPDCGTSIINHKVLGFGNVIRDGSIGIVSAAGTGLQEVSTLIHKAGLGISQAIGTGGGDLSEQVGGITMMHGLKLLEKDANTKMIVLISKPPAHKTMRRVLGLVRACRKPVVVNFLGAEVSPGMLGKHKTARTLEDAARAVCKLSGVNPEKLNFSEEMVSMARKEFPKFAKSQRYIRGLFSGGTLCYESQVILQPLFREVYSNAPIASAYRVEGDAPSKKHALIDMGAEEFVVGRPHPMIDFTLRNIRILREARDPQTALILLDIELGYGSNSDPAGQLLPAIRQAKGLARKSGRYLSIVASVVGTDLDPQGLARQEKSLRDAGVLVAPSNATAATLAALIVSKGGAEVAMPGRSN